MKLPSEVVAALDATGLPWTAEAGKNHIKLRLDGRLVTVSGHGSKAPTHRNLLNTLTQIRRAARGEAFATRRAPPSQQRKDTQ